MHANYEKVSDVVLCVGHGLGGGLHIVFSKIEVFGMGDDAIVCKEDNAVSCWFSRGERQTGIVKEERRLVAGAFENGKAVSMPAARNCTMQMAA